MTATNNQQQSVEPDEQSVTRFVEDFAGTLIGAGMPRMPSRVLSCLMATDDGMLTSAELAQRLQISPAAVSGAIRYLTTQRLVRRTHAPGSRRELYRVDGDVFYQAFVGSDQILAQWRRTLLDGINAVGADSDAGRRLTLTAEFVEFLDHEVSNMLDRWNAHLADREASGTES